MTTIAKLKERKATIRLELASRKHNYFANGIETNMRDRTRLEQELAQIEVDMIAINRAEIGARFDLKTRHYALVREHLVQIGHPDLWEKCHQLAIAELT